MSNPRSKSKKNKTSRQPSPDRLPLKLPGPDVLHSQPEAGPSRSTRESLDDYEKGGKNGRYSPLETSEVNGTDNGTNFLDNADFIAFAVSDDEETKADLRSKGKRPAGYDDEGDIQGTSAGRKRRWEESERSDGNMNSRRGVNVNIPSRKAPWTADVDWESCKNVAQLLHREVEAFANYMSPSPIEHEVRSKMVQYISDSIRRTIPDAVILPFGSFETKLYLPGGDIDLVLQSQVIDYIGKDGALRTLANIVKKAGIADKVTIISKAKVPIIKFITKLGRLSVDISLSQTNGVAAGKMINRFLQEIPALRALVLVIKSFLNQRSMNEVYSGGLGSYSIVCLAVSFLQMHPKLRRGEIDPSKNLGVLVMEFFELYGKYFNYSETGISLRHGGTYFSKARRGWVDPRKRHLLSIEDPGDISNDVSRGSFAIANVRQTFAGAYEIMKSAAFICASILRSRQRGEAYSLRTGRSTFDRLDPDEMSILSKVLGITQEVINHRRLVQEVYRDGVLDRLLGIPSPEKPTEIKDDNGVAIQDSSSRPSRIAESQSVQSAWGEMDMDLSSGSEKADTPKRVSPDGYGDEESRYDIGGGNPRKRQRKGRPSDLHTVFTTDDEATVNAYDSSNSEDSLIKEERIYRAIDGADNDGGEGRARSQSKKPLSNDLRRAFWASKSAIGGVQSDSE